VLSTPQHPRRYGPGWGPSSSAPKRDTAPQFSAHVCCGQTAGWIKMPLVTIVGLGPGNIVLDADLALNLLRVRVVAHTSWGADQQTLLHLYRSLIISKLNGCIVYGSAHGSYLQMLDPIQNHALRLCLGAYRTSPSSSLCVLANEPPLYIRRRKLSIQYCLKFSSPQHPTYSIVFNCKFKDLFERKPNQIPFLSIRVQPDLRAIGFVKRNALTY